MSRGLGSRLGQRWLQRRLMSVRTRILLVVIGVILVVLACTAVIFNILMNGYISNTAMSQLASVSNSQANHSSDNGEGGAGDSGVNANNNDGNNGAGPQMPDLSNAPPGPFNTPPAVFQMNANYIVQSPAGANPADVANAGDTTTLTATATTSTQTTQAIADALRTAHIDPNTANGIRISTASNTYYIDSVPATNFNNLTYMVYYVDVTGVVNFASRVNLFLILIMVAAVVVAAIITALVARRLTRPLESLTEFSQRLGQGDFNPNAEVFHDRELATLAESMNHAARQLDSYDKDQKLFFQNASHELRTPLMSIKCYAEGIAYDIMDAHQASATILAETDRLSLMVEDLLTLSRVDNITPDQTLTPCDLRELLAAAAAEQRSIANNQELTLTFDFDPAPVVIPCSDKLMQRAFSNLISNALRYATNKVTLTCRALDQRAVIVVANDGPGISAADLPHIFERFYQGANGMHGIGLAIVKSVVEQHGGVIDVQTSAAGTSFTLFFNAVA